MENLLFILIPLGLAFVFREVVCWYWKINEHLEATREIRDQLKQTHETLEDMHMAIRDMARGGGA